MNAPRSWPNSSLSINWAESTGQFRLTSSFIAPVAGGMDRPGDQFLASAALAGDQHGLRRGCDLGNPLAEPCICRLEPIITGGALGLPAICAACFLFHQPAVADGLAHESFELIGVERFFDVVEGPVPHGLDRRGHRWRGR